MLKAESLVALGLMGLAAFFMYYAVALPIGWVEGEGPGGGAFPFWLSLILFLSAGMVLIRSLRGPSQSAPFFDPDMVSQVASVMVALVVAVALMPVLGTYIAIPAFLIWYLRFYGGHGWVLTGSIVTGTILVLFFFFEVTLRILMPKGVTEPLFFPLYRIFF